MGEEKKEKEIPRRGRRRRGSWLCWCSTSGRAVAVQAGSGSDRAPRALGGGVHQDGTRARDSAAEGDD